MTFRVLSILSEIVLWSQRRAYFCIKTGAISMSKNMKYLISLVKNRFSEHDFEALAGINPRNVVPDLLGRLRVAPPGQ